MAEQEQPENPVEQLIELLVYAPIGLLYEYDDVLPKLIRRGKSQVQLARVIGQMAVKGRQGDPTAAVGEVAGMATNAVARLITDLGSQIGLAPRDDESAAGEGSEAPRSDSDRQRGVESESGSEQSMESEPEEAEASEFQPERSESQAEAAVPRDAADGLDQVEDEPLPVAGYDGLTAREIIGLLDDLSPAQRDRIRAHEEQGRNRKTVLAKLDRLER